MLQTFRRVRRGDSRAKRPGYRLLSTLGEYEMTKTEELVKFLEKFISGHTSKMHNDFKDFQPAYEKEVEMLTEIKERLDESDIAHWMDRCHELEAELAKRKKGKP